MASRALTPKEYDFYRQRVKQIDDDFLTSYGEIDRSPGRDWSKDYVRENSFANARLQALRVGLGQDPDYNKALNLKTNKKRKRRVK